MAKNSLVSLIKDYEEYILFADQPRERYHFRSGILALNYIIANNGGLGIPGGTIVQLLGEAKHGKSTLSLDFIAQAQKTALKEVQIPIGKVVRTINAAILDFEHSFDPVYAESLGVDITKLLVLTPVYAEDGFNIAEALLEEGLQVLVIDSVGMLVSASEEDKGYDDNEKIGSEAKVLGRFLKRANALADVGNALIIVINHYRANLSPMARSDKKPYGARILQYAVKATIKVTRVSTKGDRAEVEAFIEKTKFGPEGLKASFNIVFGKGIDYAQHILTLAIGYGIIEKRGAWYYYRDYKAQGMDQATEIMPIDIIQQDIVSGKFLEGVEHGKTDNG